MNVNGFNRLGLTLSLVATILIANAASGALKTLDGGTVAVDFSKEEGAIRPLNGVNNAPCMVGEKDCVESFRRAGIPFMRTHDTVGMWGGTHYIDIPNVFPDFDADENDPKNYDFTFSDRYLASVVRAGTEIFFRLGVTIENCWRVKRYTTNPPKDFAKWARICEHVVRHYNEGWADGCKWNIRYWEIWNEPDNPSMWSGSCEQFLDLYAISAKHLKTKFPDLKVGGFGSCGFYGINRKERSGAAGAEWGFFEDFLKWYDALLARCRKDQVPLDFFSFHLYTDDPREHAVHTAYAQKKLDEYGFKDTELINDEWNSTSFADTWSNKGKAEAYGKETHECAAYVASVLAVMQRETTLSKAMFYDACPSRSYGILYHANGRTTEAYEAFRAFDKLRQLGTSVGVTSSFSNVFALAAKDASGRQRVMIANFTDQARTVTLKLEEGARYVLSRIDDRHSVLMPTGESVVSGETTVIPWKGLVFLDKLVAEPVKIIFDTDTHGDYDDVGALAMLHKYADAGLVEILATFSCKPTGESVPVVETVNRYYGRPGLPIGAPKIPNAPDQLFGAFGIFPKYNGWFTYADAKAAPDVIAEYRRVLAAQPDKSVVICGVGMFTNFELLLQADPDLIAKKVKRLVVMACKYPEGKECNSATCPAATRYVLENWPTLIEFTDYDFGANVYTGRTVAESDPVGMNPVRDVFANSLTPRRDCFRWSWDRAEGHPSWDQTAVALAAFGLESDGLWKVQRGRYEMVGEDGVNKWTDDPNGPHARIIEGDVSFVQLAEILDGTIALPPRPRATVDAMVPRGRDGPHRVLQGSSPSTGTRLRQSRPRASEPRPVVTGAGNKFTFISPRVKEPVRFFVAGDTHMTVNDERGRPYLMYTRRMGGEQNYGKVERESFERTLKAAKAADVDLLALIGDQMSFPSWAGVEFMTNALYGAGVPWLYTNGNHDWHFEGMPGSELDLRAKYTKEILAPLFAADENPLCFTRVIKGVRFVAIDDSAHEILPEQLAYWRKEVATGEPLVLLMHIPLYVPGYTLSEGACGHPEWNAAHDPYWQIERRERWPEKGPSETTLAFRDEVFAAPNLIGVFAGHEHVLQVATDVTGAVQLACAKNGWDAQRLEVTLLPTAPEEPAPKVLPPPPAWQTREADDPAPVVFAPDPKRASEIYVEWNGRAGVPRETIEWMNLIAHDPLAKDDLPTVLTIGDSIVGNYGKPLAAELKGLAHLVTLNGSRCVGDPCLLDELRAALKVRKYDVITVNNGLHGENCTEADYARYLRDYLVFIRANLPEAKIVLVGVTDRINEKVKPGATPWSIRSTTRNRAMRKLAEEFALPFADLNSLILAHPEYHQKDGVHINAEGSVAFAKVVASEVKKILPSKTTAANAAFNAAHASRFAANIDGTWLLGYTDPKVKRRMLMIGYEAGQKFGAMLNAAGAKSSSFNTWTDIGDPVRTAVEAYLLGIDRYAAIVCASVWKDFRPSDGETRLSVEDYEQRLSDYLDTLREQQPQALFGWALAPMAEKEGVLLETLKRVCAQKDVRVLTTPEEMKAFADEAMTRPLPAANGPCEGLTD